MRLRDRYEVDFYAAMGEAAAHQDVGNLLQHRAAHCLMFSARQHFVVYESIQRGVAILTLDHQLRDIEGLIGGLSPFFLQEVEKLKAGGPVEAQTRSEKKK